MRMKRNTFFFIALIFLTFYGINYMNAQNNGEYSLKMTGISTQMVKYISGKDTVMAYLAEPQGDGPFRV